MTVIPGLPLHLQEVPSGNTPEDRARWAAWRGEVNAFRVVTRHAADRDPGKQAEELAICRQSSAYWLAMYGWFYEPRIRRSKLGQTGGDMPAIPYAFQVDVLDWIEARMQADPYQDRDDHDGAVSKSRDSGFSWTFCADETWRWLFSYPWKGLLLSRNEDYVDAPSSKSLFWKILYLLGENNTSPMRLPGWMLPKGWDPTRHHEKMFIVNPENGNTINGESSNAEAGRGDRFSRALLDEYAFMRNGANVWELLKSATDHRFAVSTEQFTYGDHHWQLWNSLKNRVPESVYEFDWHMHPEHDQDWYDRQLREASDIPGGMEKFEAEVNRNPFAATSDWYYPVARDYTAGEHIGDFPYDPEGGEVWCAIDPGLSDPTALLWFQSVPGTNLWNVIEAYQSKGRPIDYYAGVMNGRLISGLGMEADGDAHAVTRLTSILRRVTYVGDTAGTQNSMVTGTSVYDRLATHHIYVDSAWENAKRQHSTPGGRRDLTLELLPRLRWNTSSPRVVRALDAVRNSRYERKRDNSPNEPTKPLHNKDSHYRSALEYFAVNLDRTHGVRQFRRESYRSDGQGNLLPSRPSRATFANRPGYPNMLT